MSDWDGKTERRQDNYMLIEQHKTMMALLTSMDKNLALAVQRQEAHGVTLEKHIVDDKKVQDELKVGQAKINERLAYWVGGGAVVIAVGMPILNRVLETVWR